MILLPKSENVIGIHVWLSSCKLIRKHEAQQHHTSNKKSIDRICNFQIYLCHIKIQDAHARSDYRHKTFIWLYMENMVAFYALSQYVRQRIHFFHSVVIVVEKEKFWKFTQIFQLWWPWSPQVLKETNCYRPNNEFLFFQCFVSPYWKFIINDKVEVQHNNTYITIM